MVHKERIWKETVNHSDNFVVLYLSNMYVFSCLGIQTNMVSPGIFLDTMDVTN
jgi:hypothetical protein